MTFSNPFKVPNCESKTYLNIAPAAQAATAQGSKTIALRIDLPRIGSFRRSAKPKPRNTDITSASNVYCKVTRRLA